MSTAEYYLEIKGPDVKGEAQEETSHKEKIEVLSWGFGGANTASFANDPNGKGGQVSVRDLTIVKRTDISSPTLFMSCAKGEIFDTATLVCRREGALDYLTVALKDAIISSFQTGGAPGADNIPVDQVSIAYREVEFRYTPMKGKEPGAEVIHGYNQSTKKVW